MAEQRRQALGDPLGKRLDRGVPSAPGKGGIGGEAAPQIVDFALSLDPYGTSPV